MLRLLLTSLLLLSVAGAAWADGYQDFGAGVAAADRSDYDTAIKFLSAALNATDLPAHLRPAAYLARGSEYAVKQQLDPAIADYTQAIALKPDWPSPYLSRCGAYAAKRAYDSALADCTAAVQLQPQNWLIRRARIAVMIRMKKIDDVIADYSAFIQERPSDAERFLERASVYQLKGDFDRALADVAYVGGQYPKSIVADAAAGRIYFSQGNFQKAADSFDSEIAKAPQYAPGYLAKGQTLWAMGKYDDAAKAFEESLKLENLQPSPFLWLSIARSELHETVSPDIAARFAAAPPSAVEAWTIAQLYLGKTTPDALAQLTGDDPETGDDVQCTVGFYVAEWYLTQGDTAGAKRLLQSTAGLCAPNTGARQFALVALSRLP